MLIANEKDSDINSDTLQSYSLARNQLLTISSPETADYILDRLDDIEIQTLNQKFPSFIDTLTKNYKNIDKNRFIELVKNDSPVIEPKFDVSEKGKLRLDRVMTDSEIRAKIQEKKDQITATERFRGNEVIDREGLEEYQHDEKIVSPARNPQKNIKPDYLLILLNENDPNPKLEKEEIAYNDAVEFVNDIKTNRDLIAYIKLFIRGEVPKKFKIKSRLENIAFKLKYKELLNYDIGISGGGMKRKIEGSGLSNPDKVELNNGKFILDMEKLRRNILTVTYSSCRASLPSLKRENISNDVKNIITDIIKDKYNANLFNKMKPDDQRIVSTFVRTMKIPDINMREFDEAYQKNYEILLGQVNSGQNNPLVKRELKEYILRAISEGLIPKSQGYNKLFELSL
jgi:hypothetical protein